MAPQQHSAGGRPLLLFGLLLLAAHGASAASYPAVSKKPSFVAVGDGLTESAFSNEHNGWGLLLQNKYTRKVDIINRGYGGFFTDWLVQYMLADLFDVAHPALAIIFLGVKDSLTPAVSGSHYTSPQKFSSNVDAIMGAAKKAGVGSFLVITPPPVCEACKAGTPRPWDRENNHTALYVDQLRSLCSKHGGAFLDIFSSWQKDPTWHDKYLLPDKLHLSPQGNEVLANAIVSTLQSQLPALAPSAMPLNWPLMDVISKDDPAAAFSKVVEQQGGEDKKLLHNGQESAPAPAPAVGGGPVSAAQAGGGGGGALRSALAAGAALAAVGAALVL